MDIDEQTECEDGRIIRKVAMTNEHITRLEVSNFKKFDRLVVENIGQINLITGDNNVGKTSLLEVLLYSDDNLKWIFNLHHILCRRKVHIHAQNLKTKNPIFPKRNYLEQILGDIQKPLIFDFETSSGTGCKREILYKNIDELTDEDKKLRIDNLDIANVNDWVLFLKNGVEQELQWLYLDDKDYNEKEENLYQPIIYMDSFIYNDIASFAGKLDYEEKKRIVALLGQTFKMDILDYEVKIFGEPVINPMLGIATKQNKDYRPLTEYGDGMQKFFRYIVEIIYSEKKGETRLMIDEIDCGVHFSKLKDQWKAIFELQKHTNTQLFCTTHSQDCINAFVEAAEEMSEMKDKIRLIELEEAKLKTSDRNVFASTYNYNQIKAGLNSDVNLRGGTF